MHSECERWLPIPGYEPFYVISSHGRIRRIATITGKPKCRDRRPTLDKHGYYRVQLWARGEERWYSVARLVLAAFRGPCPPGMEARHKDGCSTNNRLSNLAWSPRWMNDRDKSIHGTLPIGSRNGASKLKEADIPRIRRLRNSGHLFREIAPLFGVSVYPIRAICSGIAWKHV